MEKNNKLRNAFSGCFRRTNTYMEHTSVHGLRYIVDKDAHWIERIFWVSVCAFCLFGTYVLFVASWNSYVNNAVSFVTQTTYKDWNTTFPAVSVCEQESSDKIYAFGNEVLGEDRNLNLDTYISEVLFFGGQCYACSSYCDKLFKCPENYFELSDKYRSPCQELIKDCKWQERTFDCCANFLPLRTELGWCYTINSVQTERPDENKKVELISNRFTGPGTLQFNIHENIKVYLHSPEDVPFINHAEDESQTLRWGNVLLMSLQITEIVNDPNLESVPIESRNCRFSYENNLPTYSYYSYSACVVECRAQAQMRLCGCYSHTMPSQTAKSNTTCNVTGLICLTEHQEELRSLKTEWATKAGLYCDCLSSCTEPEYKILIKDVDMQDETLSDDEYSSQVVISLESLPHNRFSRNVVRSKLDLVVSMGGTAGLFLGASLLSTVEIIYYFCIRSMKKIKDLTTAKKLTVDNGGNVFSVGNNLFNKNSNHPKLSFERNILRDIYLQKNHFYYHPTGRREMYM